MVERFDDPFSSPQRLTAAVLGAAEALGLVRAEVGRILGFRCPQFSALYDGTALLEEGSEAWRRGRLFVRLYYCLYDAMEGDRAKMVHWLRRDDEKLASSPFLLIVDEGALERVADHLCPPDR